MHTLKIVLCGGALLLALVLLGHWLRGPAGIGVAALLFLPLWLLASLGNLWVGVKRAGYSMREEGPVLLIVFAVPAIVALLVWRQSAG